jgi:hypothetical protein
MGALRFEHASSRSASFQLGTLLIQSADRNQDGCATWDLLNNLQGSTLTADENMRLACRARTTTLRGMPSVKAKASSHSLVRSGLASPSRLLRDVRSLILETRERVARTVNAGLTLLYWQIGRRIRQDILKEKRAEYGERILQSLAAKLTLEFGRGYSQRNLANMVRLAEVFPDGKILQSLIAKLGWTHFQHIIYLDDPLKRDFYAEMCRIENWSTRTLQQKIRSMLYERTALSRKPDKLIAAELQQLRAEDKLTPDLVFRDPYILEAKKPHSRRDLLDESAAEATTGTQTARGRPPGPRPAGRHTARDRPQTTSMIYNPGGYKYTDFLLPGTIDGQIVTETT